MGGFYPVSLNIMGRKCLVVGGGTVAERKVQVLLDCGARVYVVSPRLNPALEARSQNNEFVHLKSKYTDIYLEGAFLVIGATDDHNVNQRVAQDCLQRNIPVNIVDNPELCTFYVPAVIRRGDLTISISTAGKSPMLAKKIRADLEKSFGEEYAELLNILGSLRKDLIAGVPDESIRRRVYQKIIESDILNLLAQGQHDMVKGLIEDVLSSSGFKSQDGSRGNPREA